MKNCVIKEKQIEKEIINYLNYDFEKFKGLTYKEKIDERKRIHDILFERRMSENLYFGHFANVLCESNCDKRIIRTKRKLFKINTLVDILKVISDYIDKEILLLKRWRL